MKDADPEVGADGASTASRPRAGRRCHADTYNQRVLVFTNDRVIPTTCTAESSFVSLFRMCSAVIDMTA